MTSLATPVLALLDGVRPAEEEKQLLAVLSRAAPLLIPQQALKGIAQSLPASLSYAVLLSSPADTSAACDALDAGAEAVVASANDAPQLLQSGVPASRLILHVDARTSTSLPELADNGVAGALVTLPEGLSASDAQTGALVAQFREALDSKQNGRPVFVEVASAEVPTLDDVARLSQLGASLVVKTSQLDLVKEDKAQSKQGTLDLVGALVSPLKSDRADGLFPTTVVASSLGTSLGLVYSSRQSIRESLLTGSAVYQSRTRGLWRKGESSGATQEVVRLRFDCDTDAVEFTVRQRKGAQHQGFCHLTERQGCFGPLAGLAALESTLVSRKESAPKGSYTARLFSDPALLSAKIREEAAELVEAKDEDSQHVAFEAADLLYFALARCVRAGVSLEDVERSLDAKAKKVSRRKGDAKPQFIQEETKKDVSTIASAPAAPSAAAAAAPSFHMTSYKLEDVDDKQRTELLKRPSIKTEAVMDLCRPILKSVKERGDEALLELTAKFDGAKLDSPVLRPPFATPDVLAKIKPEVKVAIDQAYKNIYAFHLAQKKTGGNIAASQAAGGKGAELQAQTGEREDDAVLEMETMPGVVCRRFARPIQRVGLYVPGGTAVLPSTALMLGVPAQVARCPTIVLATPPRKDGSIAPEVLYVADRVGASCVLKAGGAQAVGAMAYGTAKVPKVDKIVGPGNQFVTAAKMLVQNDTDALVSIDMPAGPSEVLVIADESSDPDFVASDLLSQAEHGPDSQVILVGIALTPEQLGRIEYALDRQARVLPRCETVRKAIEKSLTIIVPDRAEAMRWSNDYAPEHLIIQAAEPEEMARGVINAGSIFVGPWSPESCGDYASGTNHTLPTYGLARQYSGVSTSTFEKNITSQSLTADGLRLLGPHVVHLAECEELEAHANAVRLRLARLAQATSSAAK
ncbi:putative histidine biosynthesis trifunctional protein [Acaromyces ingoldii]|uniref:Histidine biosynthesis trifunctional protein n=1 Tax=Acaromyces ingoldii TaxID=215250 RepID=A0A316YY91_9BASI|nr:putative histidine biosynthesis trifunctional protein [Acaromyces ingoldii]PWN94229.1 putative histidine biosynthesis trifunctional protein [Acaromyces ingoldii]